MYASEIFRESTLTFALPTDRLQQLLAYLRLALFPGISPNRARPLHDLLRLDVVSALGETPAAYGWHVDALLNVRVHTAMELAQAALGRSRRRDPTPPDRDITTRVYRVPRTRLRPELKLLHGGLAGDAA